MPASRALDYPADKLEIIVARGKQPSAQRNAALKAAHGEIIYFLDDDSAPEAGQPAPRGGSFQRTRRCKWLAGRTFARAKRRRWSRSSRWCWRVGWRLGRAAPGMPPWAGSRETSEKELILCNLLARRQAMLELGGFNEALYPNEENALMDELQKRGGKAHLRPATRRATADRGPASRPSPGC